MEFFERRRFFFFLILSHIFLQQTIHESCGGNCKFFQYIFKETKKGSEQLILSLRHRSLWEEKEGNSERGGKEKKLN